MALLSPAVSLHISGPVELTLPCESGSVVKRVVKLTVDALDHGIHFGPDSATISSTCGSGGSPATISLVAVVPTISIADDISLRDGIINATLTWNPLAGASGTLSGTVSIVGAAPDRGTHTTGQLWWGTAMIIPPPSEDVDKTGRWLVKAHLHYKDTSAVVTGQGRISTGPKCVDSQGVLRGDVEFAGAFGIVASNVRLDVGCFGGVDRLPTGGRQIAISGDVSDWRLGDTGLTMVSGWLQANMTKAGGAEGYGAGVSINGTVRGMARVEMLGGGAKNPSPISYDEVKIRVVGRVVKASCPVAEKAERTGVAGAVLGATHGATPGPPCDLKVKIISATAVVAHEDEKMSFAAEASYYHPCRRGRMAKGSGSIRMLLGGYKLDNLNVSVAYYCGEVGDADSPGVIQRPIIVASGSTPNAIPITTGAEPVKMNLVKVHVKGFRTASGSLDFRGSIDGVADALPRPSEAQFGRVFGLGRTGFGGGVGRHKRGIRLTPALGTEPNQTCSNCTVTIVYSTADDEDDAGLVNDLTYESTTFTAQFTANLNQPCTLTRQQLIEGRGTVEGVDNTGRGTMDLIGYRYCDDDGNTIGMSLYYRCSRFTAVVSGADEGVREELAGSPQFDWASQSEYKLEISYFEGRLWAGDKEVTEDAADPADWVWNVKGDGRMRFSEGKGGPRFPLADETTVGVTMEMSFGGADNDASISIDSVTVSGEYAFETGISLADADAAGEAETDIPAFTMAGTLEFSFPCMVGDVVETIAYADINLCGIEASNASITATWPCEPAVGQGESVALIQFDLDHLLVKDFTVVRDANVELNVFWRGSERGYVVIGTISGELFSAGVLSTSAVFIVDSGTGAISSTYDIAWTTDSLVFNLITSSTENGCDLEEGKIMTGSLEWLRSDVDSNFTMSLNGVVNCDGHPVHMSVNEADPTVTFDKVGEMLDGIPGAVQDTYARFATAGYGDSLPAPDEEYDPTATSGAATIRDEIVGTDDIYKQFPKYRFLAELQSVKLFSGFQLEYARLKLFSLSGYDAFDHEIPEVLADGPEEAPAPADAPTQATDAMIGSNDNGDDLTERLQSHEASSVLYAPPLPANEPDLGTCSQTGKCMIGQRCGAAGGSRANSDVPAKGKEYCCNKASRLVVKGEQCSNYAWCQYEDDEQQVIVPCTNDAVPPSPPSPPPPLVPGKPPNDITPTVCRQESCPVGSACGVHFPSASSGTCCMKSTRRVQHGEQCMTSRWCKVEGSCNRRHASLRRLAQFEDEPDPTLRWDAAMKQIPEAEGPAEGPAEAPAEGPEPGEYEFSDDDGFNRFSNPDDDSDMSFSRAIKNFKQLTWVAEVSGKVTVSNGEGAWPEIPGAISASAEIAAAVIWTPGEGARVGLVVNVSAAYVAKNFMLAGWMSFTPSEFTVGGKKTEDDLGPAAAPSAGPEEEAPGPNAEEEKEKKFTLCPDGSVVPFMAKLQLANILGFGEEYEDAAKINALFFCSNGPNGEKAMIAGGLERSLELSDDITLDDVQIMATLFTKDSMASWASSNEEESSEDEGSSGEEAPNGEEVPEAIAAAPAPGTSEAPAPTPADTPATTESSTPVCVKGGACPVGARCGLKGGTFEKNDIPKTSQGCCQWSTQTVQTGEQCMTFGWCKSERTSFNACTKQFAKPSPPPAAIAERIAVASEAVEAPAEAPAEAPEKEADEGKSWWVQATISGSVSNVGGIAGMTIEAQLEFETLENTWALSATITYTDGVNGTSPTIYAELAAEVEGQGTTLTGAMIVSGVVQINVNDYVLDLSGHGMKYMGPNATEEHGFTYELYLNATSSVPLGESGVTFNLLECEVMLHGKERGVGAGRVLTWEGIINATIEFDFDAMLPNDASAHVWASGDLAFKGKNITSFGIEAGFRYESGENVNGDPEITIYGQGWYQSPCRRKNVGMEVGVRFDQFMDVTGELKGRVLFPCKSGMVAKYMKLDDAKSKHLDKLNEDEGWNMTNVSDATLRSEGLINGSVVPDWWYDEPILSIRVTTPEPFVYKEMRIAGVSITINGYRRRPNATALGANPTQAEVEEWEASTKGNIDYAGTVLITDSAFEGTSFTFDQRGGLKWSLTVQLSFVIGMFKATVWARIHSEGCEVTGEAMRFGGYLELQESPEYRLNIDVLKTCPDLDAGEEVVWQISAYVGSEGLPLGGFNLTELNLEITGKNVSKSNPQLAARLGQEVDAALGPKSGGNTTGSENDKLLWEFDFDALIDLGTIADDPDAPEWMTNINGEFEASVAIAGGWNKKDGFRFSLVGDVALTLEDEDTGETWLELQGRIEVNYPCPDPVNASDVCPYINVTEPSFAARIGQEEGPIADDSDSAETESTCVDIQNEEQNATVVAQADAFLSVTYGELKIDSLQVTIAYYCCGNWKWIVGPYETPPELENPWDRELGASAQESSGGSPGSSGAAPPPQASIEDDIAVLADLQFEVRLEVNEISLGDFKLESVVGVLGMYKANRTQWVPDYSPTGNKDDYKTFFRGYLYGRAAINDVIVEASVSFDTLRKTIAIQIAVDWTKEMESGTIMNLQGLGVVVIPCKNYGDLHAEVRAAVSNIGVDWLDTFTGRASFSTDCHGSYGLELEVTLDPPPQIPITDDFSLPLPHHFSLSVKKLKGDPVAKTKDQFLVAIEALWGPVTLYASMNRTQGEDTAWEAGITLKPCKLGDALNQLNEVAPGSADNVFGSDTDSARLGRPNMHPDVAHLGVAGFDKLDEFKGSLADMEVPEISLRFMKSGKTILITVTVKGLQLLDHELDLGLLIARNAAGKWGVMIYAGFHTPEGRLQFPGGWAVLSTLLNIPLLMLGDGLRKVGIALSTIEMNLADLEGTRLYDEFPCKLGLVKKGFNLRTEIDLGVASSGLPVLFADGIESICGDPDDEDASELSKMFCKDLAPESYNNFPMDIPLSPTEMCIGKSFAGRVHMDEEERTRFTGLTFQVCLAWGGAPSFALELEGMFEFDVANSEFPEEDNNWKTIEAKARFQIEITTTQLTLEVQLSAALKDAQDQFWLTPFGTMPNLGMWFPYTFGIGVGISFTTGMPFISYFELEAGIVGCASHIQRIPAGNSSASEQEDSIGGEDECDETQVAADLGMGTPGVPHMAAGNMTNEQIHARRRKHPLSTRLAKAVGTSYTPKVASVGGIEEATNGLDELFCTDEDPYGLEPTAIKLAVYLRITEGTFAIMVILRNIYFVRLIQMWMDGPPSGFLMTFKGVLDLVSVKQFDVSVNTLPFPITMYSGTEIPAGIKLDIIDFNWFNIIKIARAYFNFVPWPPMLEAHLFIEPIEFKTGEVIIFAIKGLGRESRSEAVKKQAESEKKQAELEKVKMAQMEAQRKLAANARFKSGAMATVCGAAECYTCARGLELTGHLSISCGTPSSVISYIYDAQWGVSADQPSFGYATQPGFCGIDENGTVPEVGPTVDVTGMRTVDRKLVVEAVKRACIGLKRCHVPLLRSALGVPKGVIARDLLALSVVVGCKNQNTYRTESALDLLEGYNLRCTEGCASCARMDPGDDNVTLGCYEDSIIYDIDDATWGAADQQPEFNVILAAAMCNATDKSIERGTMCRAPDDRVKRWVKRKCLGRQNCFIEPHELEAAGLGHRGVSDPCPGSAKRLSIVATCRMSSMPLAATYPALPGEVSFVHIESRRLGRSAVTALGDSYQMRVAFQSSTLLYRQSIVQNTSQLVWGIETRSATSHTRKVHRVMTSFTTIDDKGSGGVLMWRFKVTGKKFWALGGALSIVKPSFSWDYCGSEGRGCSLSDCVRSPHDTETDSCEFDVQLEASTSYMVILYGVTRAEEPGLHVTLAFKPPTTCLYMKDCDNFYDTTLCTPLGVKKMPWHPFKNGTLPWFECRSGYHAEVTAVKAETKPFCADLDSTKPEYDQRGCMPISAEPPKGGCEGVYDAAGSAVIHENVLVAKRVGTHGVKDAQMVLHPTGSCSRRIDSSTAAAGANNLRAGRGLHMRFEEGPCTSDAEGDPLAGSAAEEALRPKIDINTTHQRYACTSKTATGSAAEGDDGSDETPPADIYTFPLGRKGNVVGSGDLKLDATGGLYDRESHDGNYAAYFGKRKSVARARVVAASLPNVIGPREGVFGADATVAGWFKKDGKTHAEGETLFSWAPKDFTKNGRPGSDIAGGAVVLTEKNELKFIMYRPSKDKVMSEDLVAISRTVVCTGRSVALPDLANGVWHHLTAIIQAAVRTDTDIKSYVSILMDGASTKIEVDCADEDPRTAFAALGWTNRRNGGLIAGAPKMSSSRHGLGGPPQAFNALERKGDQAGTGKKPFLYRDTMDTVDLYAVLVVGATYDTVSDSFIRPLSAFVDSVAYYDRALSIDEVATLATEMPCARGATGDGFAFFPGLSAASHRGPEKLKFQGLKCKPGPHTVRFRYLLAQGNDRRASVELSTAAETPTVDFSEPPGFDRDAVDAWGESTMAVLEVPAIDESSEKASPVDVAVSASRPPPPAVQASPSPPPGQLVWPVRRRHRRRRARHLLQDSPVNQSDSATLDAQSQSFTGKVAINAVEFGGWFGSGLGGVTEERVRPPPPSPPPPPQPFRPPGQWPRMCLASAWRLKNLSDIRNTNFRNREISNVQCNYQKYPTTEWSSYTWRELEPNVRTSENLFYRVTSAAGTMILQNETAAAMNQSTLGTMCGYRYPGRITQFISHREGGYTVAGGESRAEVCFASSGQDTQNELATNVSHCALKK